MRASQSTAAHYLEYLEVLAPATSMEKKKNSATRSRLSRRGCNPRPAERRRDRIIADYYRPRVPHHAALNPHLRSVSVLVGSGKCVAAAGGRSGHTTTLAPRGHAPGRAVESRELSREALIANRRTYTRYGHPYGAVPTSRACSATGSAAKASGKPDRSRAA